jgi:hypothetical protein
VTTKYLAKFQSPTAVSWPKTIQPERISKLICNLWLYTLIPKIKSISQFIVKESGDNIQLMTFNEVNTGIDQPMECLGEYHVPWVDQFLYSPKLKIINCFIIYTCMTLKQIWINTKQRRLCSPDIPVCPTSAIINLIVYRK